jgi:nitrogen regulatory protein P-II 1
MKRIEAVIRPHKQAYVLAALARLGITNVTVLETLGLGRLPGHSQIFEPVGQNGETQTGLIPKRLLLLFVEDSQVSAALEAIQSAAFTGAPGDGIVAVSPVEQFAGIRARKK